MKTFDLVSIASEAGAALSVNGSYRLRDGSSISEPCLQSIVNAAIAAERREICSVLLGETKEERGTISKWHNKAVRQCISLIKNRN